MNNLNKVLFALAIAATAGVTSNASAQYTPVADDGIAESPKVRQMLNERAAAKRVAPASASVVVTYRNPADRIAASPKVRQMLDERKVVVGRASTAQVAAVG